MESSYKFKHIENNLLKLVNVIMNNQNILRYVRYLSDNPLASFVITNNEKVSQPDIEDNLLETGHIVLTLFDEDILKETRVTMFINVLKGNLKSQPLSELIFTIDIIIPSKKWLLNGKLRPFRIADEISQEIDQKNVMGIGECEIQDFKTYKVNKNYSGLTLFIKVNSSTLKGLR